MKRILTAFLPLLITACSAVSELKTDVALTAAADTLPTKHIHSASAVDYTPHAIVEPEDWRTVNDEQSEAEK